MYSIKLLKDFKSSVGNINTCLIVDESFRPVFAPTMFLLEKAESGNADKTVQTYASRLKTFFNVLADSQLDWREISDREMSGYLSGYLYQRQNLSHSSMQNHIAALKAFYGFCLEMGILVNAKEFSFNYSKEPKSRQKQKSNALSTKLHQLYFDVDTFKNVVLGNVVARSPYIIERDELVLCMGYYAGLRAAEVVDSRNLRVEELRKQLPLETSKGLFKSISLRIIGKGSKSRNVQIPPELTERIYNFLWGRSKKFTSGPLIRNINGSVLKTEKHASNVFRDVRNRILSQTGDLIWVKRAFHTLRHIFATDLATWCYEHGKDPWVVVPENMGHSSVDITLQYIFFDAMLNNRLELIEKLSLQNHEWQVQFGNRANKSTQIAIN